MQRINSERKGKKGTHKRSDRVNDDDREGAGFRWGRCDRIEHESTLFNKARLWCDGLVCKAISVHTILAEDFMFVLYCVRTCSRYSMVYIWYHTKDMQANN